MTAVADKCKKIFYKNGCDKVGQALGQGQILSQGKVGQDRACPTLSQGLSHPQTLVFTGFAGHWDKWDKNLRKFKLLFN